MKCSTNKCDLPKWLVESCHYMINSYKIVAECRNKNGEILNLLIYEKII